MIYTFQVKYKSDGANHPAVSFLWIEGENLQEVIDKAKEQQSMIPNSRLGYFMPGKHTGNSRKESNQ